MKVTDPVAGMYCASGDPVIHFTFIITIFIINKGNGMCENAEYPLAIVYLLVAHFTNVPILFVGCCRSFKKKDPETGEIKKTKANTEVVISTLQFISMIFYMGAIFKAQDVYFFDVEGDQCNVEEIGYTRQWIFIEMITFYMGILSAIVFALFAKVFNKVPDVVMFDQADEEAAKIEEVKDLFHQSFFSYDLYAGLFVPAGVTISLLVFRSSINSRADGEVYTITNSDGFTYEVTATDQYGGILVAMAIHHITQLIFISFVLFWWNKFSRSLKYVSIGTCCCLCCIPLVMLIIQAVALAQNGSEQEPIEYNWIVSDTIQISFLTFVIAWRVTDQQSNIKIQKQQEEKLAKKTDQLANISALNMSSAVQTNPDETVVESAIVNESKQIEISPDIYGLGFCAFLKFYVIKHKIVRSDQGRIFFIVLFIFTLQILLLVLVTQDILDQDGFTMMPFNILVTRFICAMLLHASSEPEFRQSLILYKYWCNHSNNFDLEEPTESHQLKALLAKKSGGSSFLDESKSENQAMRQSPDLQPSGKGNLNEDEEKELLKLEAELQQAKEDIQVTRTFTFTHRIPPLFVALMQMVAALFTEIINIAVISCSNSVMDVVMDYIALGIIAEIDDLFADQMQLALIKDIQSEDAWTPFKCYSDSELPYSRRRGWNRVAFLFFKLIKAFYSAFYYYFFPFLIIYMNYGFTLTKNCTMIEGDGGEMLC